LTSQRSQQPVPSPIYAADPKSENRLSQFESVKVTWGLQTKFALAFTSCCEEYDWCIPFQVECDEPTFHGVHTGMPSSVEPALSSSKLQEKSLAAHHRQSTCEQK
jgi:hypothetical protein